MIARRGFTLIEVLVALTIGATAVLVAHSLFGATTELAARTASRFEAATSWANARRALSAALASAEIGRGDSVRFDGARDRVAFTSWFWTPIGREPRRCSLLASDSLLLLVVGPDSLVLTAELDTLAVDFLPERGAATAWVTEWSSAVTLPAAVRLRIARSTTPAVDTILVPLGNRG